MDNQLKEINLSMEVFLNKIREQDISLYQAVQRAIGQFSNNMINELILTILIGRYLPPIILGEEVETMILRIIDGLQRSSSFMLFKYGNHKITTLENPIIKYKEKLRDSTGKLILNDYGEIQTIDAEFNLKGKTYEDLPQELKKRFNDYQVKFAIYEKCTDDDISEYVKIYNNHVAMNSNQQAFTYIKNFADDIKQITDGEFFRDCNGLTEREQTKGVFERIVVETVMCEYHLDAWNKTPKKICNYLNKNASKKEFITLKNTLEKFNFILFGDLKSFITSKNAFIWISTFNKFTKLNLDDKKFRNFIIEFQNNLHSREVNGKTFDDVDLLKNTKDKATIIDKLYILETLMMDFLHIDVNAEESHIVDFVRENIGQDIKQDDIELYESMLEDLSLNVDNNTKLLEVDNKYSLITLIAYSCQKDIDLDDWFINYISRVNNYIENQKENYIKMREDLEKYIQKMENKKSESSMNGGKLACAM